MTSCSPLAARMLNLNYGDSHRVLSCIVSALVGIVHSNICRMVRILPVSFSMGRNQSNNNTFYNANRTSRPGYVPLNQRLSTEWDLRIDLTNGLTVTAIVERMRSFKDSLIYGLISGVEYGKCRVDRPTNKSWFTEAEEHHVHVALVTMVPINRASALEYLRPTKTGGEYAVPRNTKHTYIGWRLHHNKLDTKIGDADPLWEYGTLPMDALNGPTGLKIYYMVRTYGRPQDKITYADYIQLGQTAKNEQAKQRKRKIEEEVEELRKKVKQYEDNQ